MASSVLIDPPTTEPLTLDEGKLWAGFDWLAGDPRETLMTTVIAASRAQVEDDTGFALLTQTRETVAIAGAGVVIVLPEKCRPVQQVVSITDAAGQVIDPAWYTVRAAGAIVCAPDQPWPIGAVVVRAVVGWPTVADLAAHEPRLIHLVGRLTAHNMTLGRDLAISGTTVVQIPVGYEDEVQPYRPITLV